jgi:hypothetical protein
MERGSEMSLKILFGGFLLVLGIFYFWFAYLSLLPLKYDSDFTSWLGAALFLVMGIGSCLAGVNLLRTKQS